MHFLYLSGMVCRKIVVVHQIDILLDTLLDLQRRERESAKEGPEGDVEFAVRQTLEYKYTLAQLVCNFPQQKCDDTRGGTRD